MTDTYIPDASEAPSILITIAALVALAVLARSSVKRLLPRLSAEERVFLGVVLAFEAALMIWEGASLAGAALVFGIVLAGLHLHPAFGAAGRPAVVLARNGWMFEQAMQEEGVRAEAVEQAVRLAGYKNLKAAEVVVLDEDGGILVIGRDGPRQKSVAGRWNLRPD